ncbi:hypothetical protein [Vibrio variabilis]|uniref:hypothetical protein n=1 Tax=Vibrio variabilis TaxID=990271 RepID=UPI000DDB1B5B|nr:hypothetical protein [Vibrio variabilis]
MDVNVRRLVGRHIHFYNPMGGERVTRYEVPHAFDPDSWHDKQSAKKDLIKREKAMYGSYWSAEIHTHKFKLPRFVIYFALIVLFLFGCGYMAYSVLYGRTEPSSIPTTTESQQAAPDQASTTAPSIQTYLTEQLANVYIDGVVVQTKERRTIYHYSFSDAESGAVFSPSHLGLVVEPINRCRARVFIDDIQHILTCNPFYKREPVEESYTQLSSDQATVESIGDI